MDKLFGKAVLCSAAVAAATMMSPTWAHQLGRMTGGGSFVCSDQSQQKVTHGFELHCKGDPPATLAEPNNLEINLSGGDNFHLTTLTKAVCSDTDAIQQPPNAGFDTFDGAGTGTFNGLPAEITFTFTDGGEPGTKDTALVLIKLTGTGQTVLACNTAPLTFGNQQAHEATGSKQ